MTLISFKRYSPKTKNCRNSPFLSNVPGKEGHTLLVCDENIFLYSLTIKKVWHG